jgi:hypothetical protein
MPLFPHSQSLLYQQGTRSLRKLNFPTVAPETVNTVVHLPHGRTAEPQKQPLLSNTRTQQQNNGVMRPVSRQRLGKQVLMRNSGNCFSVDEFYCLLFGIGQGANEVAV